jgi:hypothetical protein
MRMDYSFYAKSVVLRQACPEEGGVSFDKLRTNGHFIEGLSMNGINPFA